MLTVISDLLWGPGTLALLLGTGVCLTVRTGFLPWRNLGYSLRSALGREARRAGRRGVSPFSALTTALAATLGTGNIVGVATALLAGGPGALVWMEVSALFGLGTVLAESTLSVKYRQLTRSGLWTGGPMYVMRRRLGRGGSVMAVLFSLFAACASLGIGSMTQASAAAGALKDALNIPPCLTGIALLALSLIMILGGIRCISRITALLVPLLAALYLLGCAMVILSHLEQLPATLASMMQQAFSFRAAAGGAAGFAAMRWGVARGVFSNEAGLGSSAVAAAAAEADEPVQQGYISMTAPFFDTIVLCTATGLAVCCSGALQSASAQSGGAALTIHAFSTVFGEAGSIFVALSVTLFAFSTILGWEYTGETAFLFLTRDRFRFPFRILFAVAALAGAVFSPDAVFLFSDICNALMCIPNLLCLLLLSGEVSRDICAYERIKHRKKM